MTTTTKTPAQAERTVAIQLIAGGSPKLLRRAIKLTGLLGGPELAPRIQTSWLRNGRQALTNDEICATIAALIPSGSIHVRDLGNASFASGPNSFTALAERGGK